jgi:hypothetical protein
MSEQKTSIYGQWKLTGPAAEVVLQIQAEAVKAGKAKPGKQRIIQRLLCEEYQRRNSNNCEC